MSEYNQHERQILDLVDELLDNDDFTAICEKRSISRDDIEDVLHAIEEYAYHQNPDWDKENDCWKDK